MTRSTGKTVRGLRRHAIAALLAAAAIGLLPAIVAAQAATSLVVDDQTFAAGATTLSIPSASHDAPFYAVVHEGDANSFGTDIGSTALLPAGTQTDLAVDIGRPLADGEYLWVMLHTEDNGNTSYDGASTDSPINAGAAGNASFGGVVVFPAVVTQAATPTLTVTDQTFASGATSISIASASHDAPFYVVVHEGDASSFGAALGSTALLPAGTETDLVVDIGRPLADGEYLWAMLHTEDNGNTSYDGAAIDTPINAGAAGNSNFGGIVVFPAAVSAGAGVTPPSAGSAGLSGANAGSAALTALLLAVATGVLAFGARRATAERRAR